jgi:nucleotide-binding universal stress UspA family protein
MPTTKRKDEAAGRRPDYETGPIVAGSDGSPGGEDAAALATALAGRSGRRVVAENVPGAVATSIGLIAVAEREAAGTLVVGSPRRSRVGRALLGSVEAIAKACDESVDILVAGTRKPLDRMLLGSNTGHLIDMAPCAVLVVPHEDGD